MNRPNVLTQRSGHVARINTGPTPAQRVTIPMELIGKVVNQVNRENPGVWVVVAGRL